MSSSSWKHAMRGECKTPGGKLIAVDLEVQNEIIHSVQISGDFFIHPETEGKSILQRLADSIIGQPEGKSIQQWNSRLDAALPWDIELLGTSTKALAVAICRALGQPAELTSL